MMRVLYAIGLFFYHLAIRLAALRLPKARLWVDGRRGWAQRLSQWRQQPQHANAPLVWMHCSSLGEFEQGRPVLEAIRQQYPHYRLVLTFYSPSGYELRKNYPGADYIAYLPADSPANARRWQELLRPDFVLFVKYDFWYYHLQAAFRRAVPVVLIAAHFRPGQVFFKPWGGLHRRMLAGFSHLFLQDASSIPLLEQYHLRHYSVAGDPRVDRVRDIVAQPQRYPLVASFVGTAGHTLVAGSTWPKEEAWLTHWINHQMPPDCKIIIAPHEINDEHIQQLERLMEVPCLRYTRAPQHEAPLSAARVLILDTIGMLSQVYQYGQLAYIGGGFGAGIHNTLEPAAHGIPVIFGPKHGKFIEASALIAAGAGWSIPDAAAFAQVVSTLITHQQYLPAGQRAHETIVALSGATQKIMGRLPLKEG